MNSNLVGRYYIDKSNLKGHDLHLVISQRKPAPNKPKHYLLEKLPTGGFRYISGLYPFNEDAPPGSSQVEMWQLDWEGFKYILSLDRAKNEAQISPLNLTRLTGVRWVTPQYDPQEDEKPFEEGGGKVL